MNEDITDWIIIRKLEKHHFTKPIINMVNVNGDEFKFGIISIIGNGSFIITPKSQPYNDDILKRALEEYMEDNREEEIESDWYDNDLSKLKYVK